MPRPVLQVGFLDPSSMLMGEKIGRLEEMVTDAKLLRHFDTSNAAFSWQLDYASNTARFQVRLFIMSIKADIRGILVDRAWEICAVAFASIVPKLFTTLSNRALGPRPTANE